LTFSDDSHQTTAVTSRWRRRYAASLVLARTAAQVADLSNQHPRHGRHAVAFTTTTMLRCSVAVVFAINHRFARPSWNSWYFSSWLHTNDSHDQSSTFTMNQPGGAGCCYRRHRQRAGPKCITPPLPLVRYPPLLLPVLKMSGAAHCAQEIS